MTMEYKPEVDQLHFLITIGYPLMIQLNLHMSSVYLKTVYLSFQFICFSENFCFAIVKCLSALLGVQKWSTFKLPILWALKNLRFFVKFEGEDKIGLRFSGELSLSNNFFRAGVLKQIIKVPSYNSIVILH